MPDDQSQDQREADVQNDTERHSESGKGELGNKDEALSRLGRQRDAERERANTLEAELNAIRQKQREADEARAKEQGEWKTLAEQREAALTAATTERDALKGEHDALTAYFDAQYTTAFDRLPDVIKEFAPPEDASFAAKAEWLTKAQAQAAKLADETRPGNRPNPKPTDGKVDIPSAVPRARMW